MRTFAFVSDAVFYSVAAFALSLLTFGYFIPYPYTLVAACSAAALSALAAVKSLSSKRKKFKLASAEKKQYAAVMNGLKFSPPEKVASLFSSALKTDGITAEKRKGGLSLKNKNVYIFLKFGFDPVTKSDVVRAFNSITKGGKAYILSESFGEEIKSFAAMFGGSVILVGGEECYKYLKSKNRLPENRIAAAKEKLTFRAAIGALAEAKKAKNYLLFGIFFLATGYFVPFKVYYVVCGTIMIFSSIVVRLFGKRNSP